MTKLKEVAANPLFLVGLILRIGMILFLIPDVQSNWFLPFMQSLVAQPTIDPWTQFLDLSGSDPLAFPYGVVMVAFHLPFYLIGHVVDSLASVNFFSGLGFRLALLIADYLLLVLLLRLFESKTREVLLLYWLSPVVLFVNYWHGQTDAIPVVLMALGLLSVSQTRMGRAGLFLSLAVAAKHSMLLVFPFVAIYVFQNKRFRPLLTRFMVGGASGLLLWSLPALFSEGYRTMVLSSPEAGRVFHLSASIGPELSIYLSPLLFLMLLYTIWRMSWISFELLMTILGLLATPAPAGWFLWIVPFLVAHQVRDGKNNILPVSIFSALLVGYHLLYSSGPVLSVVQINPGEVLSSLGMALPERLQSLWMTALIGFGLVIVVQMVREGIFGNRIFRLGRKPVAIGIAGDSGSGKDTLSLSLAGLFGEHSVVHISGDDYHIWDRQGAMWKTMTPLNPRANRIHEFSQDLVDLSQRKPISCRTYDHETGTFTGPEVRRGNNVLIASGLHALYTQAVSSQYHLRIFLNMSEDLRRFLKTKRDTSDRGHDLLQVVD
jgi:uridine kinase